MKVLVCWPPHVPSYFNAGHHLPVFSISAYLREQGYDVDALDAGALNYSWKEYADLLFQGDYDSVVLINDFDVVEGVRRAADYARGLLPRAGIVTVGRLSYQNPGFFESLDLDAVACRGDYEVAVRAALGWFDVGQPAIAEVQGVSVRTTEGWQRPSTAGEVLQPEQWVLPRVSEIPYASYEALYRRDANKFCGIPERRELVVPVARGCPINCSFCDVPVMQGLRERRLSVLRVLDYIRSSFASHPFEYVAFYAPTFTLNRRWVHDLCASLINEPRAYPWKCATTLHHLDEDLVAAMAASGCVRISAGIETFEAGAAVGLPRIKQSARERFELVAGWCGSHGIELNCFVIVGLPGTTPVGTRRTIEVVRSAGARVRPTLYTPYDQMHAEMSEREMSAFNRQLFVDAEAIRSTGHAPEEFLSLLFGDDAYVTPTSGRIHSHPNARLVDTGSSRA